MHNHRDLGRDYYGRELLLMPEKNDTDLSVGFAFPGEGLVTQALKLAEKIIDGQPVEVKREIWERLMEFTRPFHEIAVQHARQLAERMAPPKDQKR